MGLILMAMIWPHKRHKEWPARPQEPAVACSLAGQGEIMKNPYVIRLPARFDFENNSHFVHRNARFLKKNVDFQGSL
jgi:hypothetical protein